MVPDIEGEAGSARAAAFTAYERGDPDAADKLTAALRLDPLDGGLIIADARLRAARGDAGALDALRAMLRRAPDWLDGHVALAQLLWEEGRHSDYTAEIEHALRLLPRHAGLWARYIGLLAGSGAPAKAADIARQLRGRVGDLPALRLMEAHHAGMAGDMARAEALLLSIPDDLPGRALEAARHRLRAGDPAAAIPLLDRVRAQGATDPLFWALTELAWRAAGDPRHAWLIDPAAMIGTIDGVIGEASVASLAGTLRALHRGKGRPLGQSVRGGTQTSGNLALRAEPDVKAAFEALSDAVRAYLSALPPADPAHPLLAHRDRPVRFAASWSIRLQGSGFHINHIHSEGVMSSACYIAVPPALDREAQEGWLALGLPPEDIALPLEPLATVEPRPGRLCLFPSFLYHGTRPFRAGERITIAFDVAPAA